MRRAERLRRLAAVLMATALVAAALPVRTGRAASPEPEHKRLTARISHVFDGSSFQLAGGLRSSLIGAAAPALNARGGREAFAFLRHLIEGRTVELEVDEQLVDPYGQPQYYVFLPDQTMVNILMIVRGYARAVVKYPNIRYREKLIEAEKTAKTFHRGIWGDEFPDPKAPRPPFDDPYPRRRFPF